MKIHPVFHVSHLKQISVNSLFPPAKPPPVLSFQIIDNHLSPSDVTTWWTGKVTDQRNSPGVLSHFGLIKDFHLAHPDKPGGSSGDAHCVCVSV